MRRLISPAAAFAMMTALTTGAAAQAKAADPVAALAAQLKSAHGVHFTSVSKIVEGVRSRTYGDLQFGRSQVAASDVIRTVDVEGKVPETVTDVFGEFQDMTAQVISVKGATYVTASLFDLPAGKSWIRYDEEGNMAGLDNRVVNVMAPSELRDLLATTTSKKPGGVVDGVATTLHTGRIWEDWTQDGSPVRWTIHWKLWIGAEDGLIRRIMTHDVLSTKRGKSTVMGSDTRLTSWGEKVWIDAPAGKYVMGVDDAFDHAVKPNVIGLIDLGG